MNAAARHAAIASSVTPSYVCHDRDYGAFLGAVLDPRTDDADRMDPRDALEQAVDELLHQPESVADLIAVACTGHGEEVLTTDEERLALSTTLMKGDPVLIPALLVAWLHSDSIAIDRKLKLAMREHLERIAATQGWVRDRVAELSEVDHA